MKNAHYPALRHAVLAVALASTSLAHASSNILLKFEGGTPPITGTSTLDGHRGSIEASSFLWGMGVGVTRTGGKTEVSAPSISDIVWTQAFDPSYNALSQALTSGGGNYTSTFSFLRNRGGQPETYLTMKTEQAAIDGLSFSTGGGAPSVSASQAFRKFEMTYAYRDVGTPNPTKLIAKYDSLTGKGEGSSIGKPTGTGELTGSAQGSAGLYLSLGTGLGGESVVRGYENWIELSSAQMGMGITLTPKTGGIGGFFASRPSISELTVTQSFDRSVIGMLGALMQGTMINEARLELVENTSSGAVTTMQMKLEDVRISGLSLSSGGDLPQVSESFNFGAYTQTIWELDAQGRRGGASVFSFDTRTGESEYSSIPQASSGGLPGASGGMAEPPGGISPIPEPHTWALMTGGIAMLLVLRRRRLV